MQLSGQPSLVKVVSFQVPSQPPAAKCSIFKSPANRLQQNASKCKVLATRHHQKCLVCSSAASRQQQNAQFSGVRPTASNQMLSFHFSGQPPIAKCIKMLGFARFSALRGGGVRTRKRPALIGSPEIFRYYYVMETVADIILCSQQSAAVAAHIC